MTRGKSSVPAPPLHVVPAQVAARVGELAFAGRYIPAGPGREPIAGDFYDVLPLGPDRVAILVGDVAGHGASAQSRMQELRAAAHAYAAEQQGPASVLHRLDAFCARLDDESIATVWYGEYTPSTGTLTHAAAGHLPPMLTVHGDPAQLLEIAPDPPLGVGLPGQLTVEHTQVLPVGAVLVAYSDGLVERHRRELDDQLARLQQVVTAACDPQRRGTAEQIAGEILDALVPDPKTAADDVCVLVVRREPAPPSA